MANQIIPKTFSFSIQRERRKRIVTITVIITLLGLYSIVTITPFYFLFIRSFVPTAKSTTFYMSIPQDKEFNLQAKFGNTATFYNLDVTDFKKDMGISGFLNTNLTIEQIGTKYNIPNERLIKYFQPYYLYNGWISEASITKSFFSMKSLML